MTNFIKVLSQDAFAELGITAILRGIMRKTYNPSHSPITIVVFSRMTLSATMKYYQRLDPEGAYIVIGNAQAHVLLAGNTTLKIIAFIDISLPVFQMRDALLQAFLTPFVPTKIKVKPLFTLREREVLNYLIRGKNTVQTAFQMGLSPKTVSSYKRSVMIKLQVPNNQALYCKLAFMRSQNKENAATKCYELHE